MNWQNSNNIYFLRRDITGNKLAVFGYEDTIVDKKNIVNKKMIDFIKTLYDKNFDIIIISNQGQYPVTKITPIGVQRPAAINDKVFQNSINNILNMINVPVSFCYTTDATKHKPNYAMWQTICNKSFNKNSFYMGGHSGRPGELTNDDLLFAKALGLTFKNVEIINDHNFMKTIQLQEKRTIFKEVIPEKPKPKVESTAQLTINERKKLFDQSNIVINNDYRNIIHGNIVVDTNKNVIPSSLAVDYDPKNVILSGLAVDENVIKINERKNNIIEINNTSNNIKIDNTLENIIKNNNLSDNIKIDNTLESIKIDNLSDNLLKINERKDNIKDIEKIEISDFLSITNDNIIENVNFTDLLTEEKEITVIENCKFTPTDNELVIVVAPPGDFKNNIINILKEHYKLITTKSDVKATGRFISASDMDVKTLKRYLVFDIKKEKAQGDAKALKKYYEKFAIPQEKLNVLVHVWQF